MPYRRRFRAGNLRRSRHKTRARRHASGVIGRAWRKRRGRVMTNRKLTSAVKQLRKQHAIKAHYVVGNAVYSSIPTPQVVALTGIGAGEASNQHEGDSIQLRSLTVKAYVSVSATGAVPDLPGPTRYNMMIVSSVMDVGLADVPSYSNIYDGAATHLPANMALFDGFRELNNETLYKVKILASKSFTLQPNQETTATQGTGPTYPSFKFIKFNMTLNRAKIEYRTGTSTPLNRNYYLMFMTNSLGAGPSLGAITSYTSKLTFYDIE